MSWPSDSILTLAKVDQRGTVEGESTGIIFYCGASAQICSCERMVPAGHERDPRPLLQHLIRTPDPRCTRVYICRPANVRPSLVKPPELDPISGELKPNLGSDPDQLPLPWEQTLAMLWTCLDQNRARVSCCTVQEAIDDAIAHQLTRVLCAGSLYLVHMSSLKGKDPKLCYVGG